MSTSAIRNLLTTIPNNEDEKTIELFRRFGSLQDQNCLSLRQLLEILKWKSPRPLQYYKANSEEDVNEITTIAFATESDCLKIHTLTALKGVSYPAASAILMFYDKTKYPVLDIRVWQQLYNPKLVDTNPKGQNFTLQQWKEYLKVIRGLAKDLGLTARQVEKRLFDYDRESRQGKLYSNNGKL